MVELSPDEMAANRLHRALLHHGLTIARAAQITLHVGERRTGLPFDDEFITLLSDGELTRADLHPGRHPRSMTTLADPLGDLTAGNVNSTAQLRCGPGGAPAGLGGCVPGQGRGVRAAGRCRPGDRCPVAHDPGASAVPPMTGPSLLLHEVSVRWNST